MLRNSSTPREISFLAAKNFWAEHLWPGRPESLRPMSAMLFAGGFDLSLRARYEPIFFGLHEGDTLVGVNSGHFTAPKEFRSRGLVVRQDFRGRRIGALLLARVIEAGREAGAELVWSYPKDSAWGVYAKAGFVRTERRLKAEDQNCYAYLDFNSRA